MIVAQLLVLGYVCAYTASAHAPVASAEPDGWLGSFLSSFCSVAAALAAFTVSNSQRKGADMRPHAQTTNGIWSRMTRGAIPTPGALVFSPSGLPTQVPPPQMTDLATLATRPTYDPPKAKNRPQKLL